MRILRRGGFSSAWNHDYPRAEQHLSQIVKELTALDIRTDGSLILTLDDPELFNYPIAFMWEPGFWNLTDREARVVPRLPAQGGLRGLRGLRRRRSSGATSKSRCGACCPRRGSSGSTTRIASTTRSSQIKDIDAIVHPM